MVQNTLTSDGFPTKTKEQELITETEDMRTDDFTKEDVDSLLSKGNTEFEEEIRSAQVPKQTKERPSTSNHQQNGPGRKRHRHQDKLTKTSTCVKRSNQDRRTLPPTKISNEI